MHVAVSDDAYVFIRQNGGRLYVWGDGAGDAYALIKVGTPPPPRGIEFRRFESREEPSFPIFVAADIEPADLYVDLRRWPTDHLFATTFSRAGRD